MRWRIVIWLLVARVDAQGSEPASEALLGVPAMLCSKFTRPKVAICLHGAARSFPHLLVFSSLKRNLIEALGASTTSFLHVILKDARADPRPQFGGLFPDRAADQIEHAARHLGIAKSRTQILEGPNAPLPSCPNYERAIALRRAEKTNYLRSMEYLYSLAGQLSHHEGCMNLIRQEEDRRNSTFHEVILARADLTVYNPLPPYCMFEHTKPRRLWDWYYHVPREQADRIFSEPYQQFYRCRQNLGMNQTVENYRHRWLRHVAEDNSLPFLVTRLDQSDMPNNLCSMFALPSASSGLDRVDPLALCGPMTYQNPFNRLPP
mmetsp:Transcript_95414/g.172159  ORF Transcript_95414/g.172159 Transcript_95414/m.172159 type:complete len:320 (+) Transcript_95414:78-1037(+)